MFVGRNYELDQLNKLYNTNKFQMPVIYGRRRVGKTALINEFIKGKKAIFFTGIESNSKQNLESFSKSIFRYIEGRKTAPVFIDFTEALEFVFEIARKEQIVLVIDEYPYLAKASKSFSSILQGLIDKNHQNSKLFLVLSGSSMSFMENQVLGYSAPLFGRRTAQFKMLPFTFKDSCQFFNKFTKLEMALIYGAVGGTPQYLFQMDDSLSFEENIKQKLLNKSSYLSEEPNNLLLQEVRDANLYSAILTAIATGSNKLSEITDRVGEERSACAFSLKNLVTLGLVNKTMPISETSKKKTIYSIADNLFRFWYRFVSTNEFLVQNQMIDEAYELVNDEYSSYMGLIFEDICKQYLWEKNREKELPFIVKELGRWWGNNPNTKSQDDVDIMGIAGNDSAILAECKWTNDKIDISTIKKLMEKKRIFDYRNVYFYFFSKSGFTEGSIELAKQNERIFLISFCEM
ncbi:MAG: ATP-binding protein [Anaerovoracaceae bacterium]